MRNIFIVIAKLIGLLQIYWGISYIAALTLAYGQMRNIQVSTPSSQSGDGFLILPTIGFALLTFGLAYILLFCTEGLARLLGIIENKDSDKLPINLVLQAGIKLIGVYLVALTIPEIFKSLSEWIFTVREYSSIAINDTMYADIFRTAAAKGFFSSNMPLFLKLCIGLFAALRTNTVIRLITKDQKEEESAAGYRRPEASRPDP